MPTTIANKQNAFIHEMHFNFGDHGWRERHFLNPAIVADRPTAIAAAKNIALYRLTCLLGSCEMVWSRVSDLDSRKDGAEAEPYVGCVWPIDGWFGPGHTFVLDIGGATAGTYTLIAATNTASGVTGPLTAAVSETAVSVQTGLRGITGVPGMGSVSVKGSNGGPFTITGVPTNVNLVASGLAALTGQVGANLSAPQSGNVDTNWDVNEITDAIMLRAEAELGLRWGNMWIHGIPDQLILGGQYLGTIIIPAVVPPATAPPPPGAAQSVIWGTTTFDQVVADYINVLWNNTALLSKSVSGGVPTYTSYNITKLKPKFVRGHKVGRPTDSARGRATPR